MLLYFPIGMKKHLYLNLNVLYLNICTIYAGKVLINYNNCGKKSQNVKLSVHIFC